MKHTSIYKHPDGGYWEATARHYSLLERTNPSEPFEEEDLGSYSTAEKELLDMVQYHLKKGYALDRSGWVTDDTANVFADFRTTIEAKYQQLHAHPEVFFTHFILHPPATPEAIAQQEERLGFPLPKDLKDFYQITNGLTFRWLHTQSNHAKEVLEFNKTPINKLVYDYLYPPECFNILPIETLVEQRQEPNYYDEHDHHTEAIFYLVDKRNMYSGNLAFRFDRATGTYHYATDHDHFASMDDYAPNSFQAYVEQEVLKPWTRAAIDGLVEQKKH